jgi:putative membrane protein (TIGR04086 family)
MFSGLRPRAILIGTLVDYLTSMPVGLVLIVILSLKNSVRFWDESSNEALDALTATPEFMTWALLLGMMCTAFGGYVAANQAGCRHAQHGAFVGLASLLIGFLFYLSPPPAVPLPQWYQMLGVVASIPIGAAGGWLASRVTVGAP